MIRHLVDLRLIAAYIAISLAACDLNPQPFPPAEGLGAADDGAAMATDDGGRPNIGTGQQPSDGGTAAVPPSVADGGAADASAALSDASVTDAALVDGDAGDAGASADGDAGDAGDGSSADAARSSDDGGTRD